MKNMLARTLMAVVAAAALLAGAAGATDLRAVMDGSQEVPPVNTPATGLFTATLDDVTLMLSYQIDYANLLGPTTASHLHRAPVGVNGPVVYTLAGAGFPSGHQGVVQVAAGDVPMLLSLGFYCNVHSQVFPGGEIRGQVEVVRTTAVEPTTWGRIKDLYQ